MSITAEQVIEAYKVTGLKPRQDEWFGFYEAEGRMCGCGLTALVVQADPKILEDLKKAEPDEIEMEAVVNEGLGLTFEYIKGFIRGFDGHNSIEVETGFADGKAAWKAVAEEFNIIKDDY